MTYYYDDAFVSIMKGKYDLFPNNYHTLYIMRLSKNKTTLYNIISSVVLQGLSFFSGPIFANVLGTENYGIAAVYLTWVTLASTVFSLQAAGTIAIAQVNFSEDKQNEYQSSVLSLASISYFIFSVLTVIVVLICSIWFHFSISMILVGLVQGWGMYCVSTMNAKLTYEFKADKNLILSISVSVSTIAFSILLIYCFPSKDNYWGRIIGQSIVYFILGLAILIYMLRNGRKVFDKTYWCFTLPIAIPTIFHLLAAMILNQSDKIMIKSMIDNSAAGVYALAATFGMVIHSIWTAFNNSWVPFYYDYTKRNQIDEMRRHAKNYIELFTILTAGFILLSREVFHVYANKDFWSGTDLISIFAIGHYFVFLYSFPANYEFYHKKTKIIAIGTTLAAVCNIALNFVMIMILGIKGAVFATALSQVLLFFFHFVCAKKYIDDKFPFRISDFIPSIVLIAMVCAIDWFARDIWIIRWLLGITLGIMIILKILRRKEIF